MRFKFTTKTGDDGQKVVSVHIFTCAICQQDHDVLLLYLESPIRIRVDHTTYRFRVECPTRKRHILIEDWETETVNACIARGPNVEDLPPPVPDGGPRHFDYSDSP